MDAQKFSKILKSIKSNKKAVDAIYSEYYLKLKIRIERKFGRLVDAEDMVQSVFLKLMEGSWPNDVEFPTTWLCRLAENFVKDFLKNANRETEFYECQQKPFDLDSTILGVDLKEAMLKLDPVSREILYLYMWEGYSHMEIAKIFNLEYDNTRKIASRAAKALRSFM